MASTISAGTTTSTGLVCTADTSGALQLATNNGTTALTLDTSQNATFVGSATVNTIKSAAATALTLQSAGTTAVTFDTSQNATFAGYANLPNTFGFKNRIINGAMGIWQRGTSQTFTNSLVYGSVDRWVFIQGGGSASIAQTQSTSVPTGFQYAIKQQRTAASTTTGTVYSAQEIESVNCYDLAGQAVTLSFWAKCGANFSASGSTLTSLIYQGTGVDQGTTSWISGTWTSPTSNTQSNTLTTTYQKFTQTVTLGSSTTELLISLQWVPVGTAGADDSVFITGVQLEKSSTATSFDYRPYGTEMQLCQRYARLCGMGMVGNADNGGTYAYLGMSFGQPMRAAPTASLVSGATITVGNSANTYTATSPTIVNSYLNANGSNLRISGFSGQGDQRVSIAITDNWALFSAEL